MYEKFREGICRVHLRALQEWIKLSSAERVQPEVAAEEDRRCVRLFAKVMGGATRMVLQLLVQNATDAALESLVVLLYVTSGKLLLERSHVQLPLMLPHDQQRVLVHFRDSSNQGGQITVVILREQTNSKSTVVCSAKIDISPTI